MNNFGIFGNVDKNGWLKQRDRLGINYKKYIKFIFKDKKGGK